MEMSVLFRPLFFQLMGVNWLKGDEFFFFFFFFFFCFITIIPFYVSLEKMSCYSLFSKSFKAFLVKVRSFGFGLRLNLCSKAYVLLVFFISLFFLP